jgi:hypothetical protein
MALTPTTGRSNFYHLAFFTIFADSKNMNKILHRVNLWVLCCALLTFLSCASGAISGRPSLAVLPFTGTGITRAYADAFTSLIAIQPDLSSNFSVVPITSLSLQGQDSDQGDTGQAGPAPANTSQGAAAQDDSTDLPPPVTITPAIPKKPAYILCGAVGRFGTTNLIELLILQPSTGLLVSGSYRSFQDLKNISNLIPGMISEAVSAALEENGSDKITIPAVPEGDKDSATNNLLTEMLSIAIANNRTVKVYPLTPNIITAYGSLNNATGGDISMPIPKTDDMLTLQVSPTFQTFTASILQIKSGTFIRGAQVSYGNLNEGPNLLPGLASSLFAPPTPPLPAGKPKTTQRRR